MKLEIIQYFDVRGLQIRKLAHIYKFDRNKIKLAMIHVYRHKFENGEDIKEINLAREVRNDAREQKYTELDRQYQDSVEREIAILKKNLINKEESAIAGWIIAGFFILMFVLNNLHKFGIL